MTRSFSLTLLIFILWGAIARPAVADPAPSSTLSSGIVSKSATAPQAPNNSVAGTLPPAPTPAPPVDRPTDAHTADLNSVAQYAIQSSRETTETIKWVFGIAATIVAGVITVLSWLGYKSVVEVTGSIEKTAATKMAEVEAMAAKRLAEVESRMNSNMESCNLVSVHSLEAVRLAVLAEHWNDTPQTRFDSQRAALTNILRAQKYAANVAGFERAYAWTLGMEAYIEDQLGMYTEAIEAQKKAIEAAKHDRAMTDYRFHYNLACYLVRAGSVEQAIEPLRRSFVVGGEEARLAAWQEEHLLPLRELLSKSDRLVAVMGARPERPRPTAS